jgi:PAS domain S-box-containing protein
MAIVVRWGVAVVSVAVAVVLTLPLHPDVLVSPLFFLAVIVSAWFGGGGPGLLATLLAMLAMNYFFLPPFFSLTIDPANLAQLLVFFGSAALVIWGSVTRQRTLTELRRARDELEARVQERTADLSRTNETLQAEIGERRRVETSLREQAALVDLTHDTVFVRDMNDVITFWNRGAEQVYGWSRAEAVGQMSHRLMQTIFPAPLDTIMAQVVDAGRWEGELVHTRRDGSTLIVASRWSLQRDEHGKPVAILETNNDVTEQKRAEEALRESAEQWRAVFENNPTMYFMVDAAGTVVSVNPFGAEQLGYTVGELIRRPVLDVFHEADREAVRGHVAACLGDMGRAMSWELRKVRKNGTTLWVRETARAMRIRGRAVVLVVCEDVTERKRAEEDLRRTEQRLTTVIANSPIILFALDRSGIFTLSEGKGLEAVGLAPGDVVGRSVFDVYRDVPQVLSAVRRALAGEAHSEVVEVRNLVFDTHYRPFLDDRGMVAGVNGVATDITARKRAEEALSKAQSDLAHVTRVTAMGELTSSIAHEINQPLAAVTINANAGLHWLDRDPPNLDEARECLQGIIRDGERASEIIARIRALVKKSGPAKAAVALDEAIREVLAMASMEARRNGVVVHADLVAGVPPAWGDRVQLQQVILNLVMNGIEATRMAGDRPREVLVSCQPDEPGTIRVVVRDSGVGLEPDGADRIFEAFYTTKPQGLGMGLSISRSIIEAHGGRLWATANEGHGATFQFTLPAARRERA